MARGVGQTGVGEILLKLITAPIWFPIWLFVVLPLKLTATVIGSRVFLHGMAAILGLAAIGLAFGVRKVQDAPQMRGSTFETASIDVPKVTARPLPLVRPTGTKIYTPMQLREMAANGKMPKLGAPKTQTEAMAFEVCVGSIELVAATTAPQYPSKRIADTPTKRAVQTWTNDSLVVVNCRADTGTMEITTRPYL